jgi:hypothetical protein
MFANYIKCKCIALYLVFSFGLDARYKDIVGHVTRRREAVVWSVGAASCFGGVSEGAHAAVSSNTSGQSLVIRRWPLYGSLALRFANHRRQHSCFCTSTPPRHRPTSTSRSRAQHKPRAQVVPDCSPVTPPVNSGQGRFWLFRGLVRNLK